MVRLNDLDPARTRPSPRDRRTPLGLLHELAHAEALDHPFGPAAALAQAIWFFLPPVWWIRDRMRLDPEFLADRRASPVRDLGRYASSLVELASGRPARPTGAAPGPAGRPGRGVGVVPAGPDAPEVPVRDRGPAPRLVAVVNRGDARRGDAGGVMPDPPRARRLVRGATAEAASEDRPIGPAPATDYRAGVTGDGSAVRSPGPGSPTDSWATLEILAEPDELPDLEILGHHLGPVAGGAGPKPGGADDPGTRSGSAAMPAEEIRVNGGERSIAGPPRPRKPAFWLTIRPAPG